jgi:hypothetical protein
MRLLIVRPSKVEGGAGLGVLALCIRRDASPHDDPLSPAPKATSKHHLSQRYTTSSAVNMGALLSIPLLAVPSIGTVSRSSFTI